MDTINLDNFLVEIEDDTDEFYGVTQPLESTISINLPYQSCFRVNPNQKPYTRIVSTAHANKKWWLIDSKLKHSSPNIQKAEFFEAIWDDGRTFLIPVTLPTCNNPNSQNWHDSLMEAIKAAQKHWVTFTKGQYEFSYQIAKAPRSVDLDWSTDYAELLTTAFNTRIITTKDQLFRIAPRKPREIIEEP